MTVSVEIGNTTYVADNKIEIRDGLIYIDGVEHCRIIGTTLVTVITGIKISEDPFIVVE